MQENLTIDGWEDGAYRDFVEKFKAKKTTDDCYTPELVYRAVASWVAKEYDLSADCFVRPFWPGWDFEAYDYAPGAVVVDNPPFSILSRILRFYQLRGIPFFLFAPALTLFSSSSSCACLPVGVNVTYENGAKVPTSFVTNLEPDTVRVRSAQSLFRAVKTADDEGRKAETKSLPKYSYPDHIITAAMVQRWCKYGVDYTLTVADSLPIDALDAQRARGLSIFGSGYLLSSRAAAERAAAERAAAERAAAERWELSERELEMVRYIDKRLE